MNLPRVPGSRPDLVVGGHRIFFVWSRPGLWPNFWSNLHSPEPAPQHPSLQPGSPFGPHPDSIPSPDPTGPTGPGGVAPTPGGVVRPVPAAPAIPSGMLIQHRSLQDDSVCVLWIPWVRRPGDPNPNRWTLLSLRPLSIQEPFLCPRCHLMGWIRDNSFWLSIAA